MMRKLLIFIFFYLNAGIGWTQTGFPSNGPENQKTNYLVFTHATIQVDPNTQIQDGSIIVQDGKILQVGTKLAIPKEAKEIDLKGQYVYPSFIDLYSNYGMTWENPYKKPGDYEQFIGQKPGAYYWNEAIRAEINAAQYFNPSEKKAKTYLEAGFGAVLTSIHDGVCRGSAAMVLLGSAPAQKMLVKPNAAAAWSFMKGSSTQAYPSSAMGSIALIRQSLLDAEWYGSQTEEKNLTLESLFQLRQLPAVFEAENKFAILRAAKIAKEFNLTVIIKGAGDEYQRSKEIGQTNYPLIVPIAFPKAYEVEDPLEAQKIGLADLKHWEMAPANLSHLAKEGIPFSITMDGCKEPQEFLDNLRKAVKFGLSQQKALEALTTTPAKLMKMDALMGSIQVGKKACFFVSSGNLFDKESIITQNWINGEAYMIKPAPEKSWAGTYHYRIDNGPEGKFEVNGKGNKPAAKSLDKDSLPIQINVSREQFAMSWKSQKDTTALISGIAWNFNDSLSLWKGQARMQDGTMHPLMVERLSLAASKPEKKDTQATANIGDVIFPFTEYGQVTPPSKQDLVFRHATVWTNETQGILADCDVAISNGKITAIGKSLPAKGKDIDATGKVLTNGIIDEHSHIGLYRGVNEGTQAVTSEVRIGDVINSDDINIYRQLAGGVVACQQLHGSANPIGGQSSLIKFRWGEAPEKLKIDGADGFIKFALGENVKQSNWGDRAVVRYPQTRMGVEQVFYDAFLRAKQYEQRLKASPKTTRRDLELEALVEVLRQKRFITCHSYVQSEINMLMHVADSMGFKVNTFTHILEGYKVADKMKAHGVSASTFADWWAYKYEVMEAIPYNAAILNGMGVVTAINSDDAEMGRRLNQEAAKIVKYGNISEQDAWKMVTLNPAKMLHLDQHMGSIKEGKDADLVLWSGNPLSIYSKPEMTFVDGTCYYSLEADQKLREANTKERQRLIAKMIAAKVAGEKTERKISVQDENYHCDDN